MNNLFYITLGIIIPFIGTSIGSSLVFILKNNLNKNLYRIMIGFAIGIMLAASIWSLIIPSIEMAKVQKIASFIPASIGLLLGIIFLIITNNYIDKFNDKKINMLLFSVTLHNIPEGMAVGVCLAGAISLNNIKLIEAILLSIGIAIQNIPEGAIISMPLRVSGQRKTKSFLYGVLSGIVEPIAAIITIFLLNIVVPLLPYLLSLAAGAMLYVIIEDLIPEMHTNNKSYLGIISIIIGFIIMMTLDITLG